MWNDRTCPPCPINGTRLSLVATLVSTGLSFENNAASIFSATVVSAYQYKEELPLLDLFLFFKVPDREQRPVKRNRAW